MVLVEDAYVSAKYSTRFSWLVELEEHDTRLTTATNQLPQPTITTTAPVADSSADSVVLKQSSKDQIKIA